MPTLSGNATTVMGSPASLVIVRSVDTYAHVAAVTPDALGNWSINFPEVSAELHVDITYHYPGCDPQIHGPYTLPQTIAYVLHETWSAASPDPLLWSVAVDGSRPLVTVSGGHLNIGQSGGSPAWSSARVTSAVPVPTSGAVEIVTHWTPTEKSGVTGLCPYLALVPSGVSRAPYWAFPLSVPTLRLGHLNAIANRNGVYVGYQTDGSQNVWGGQTSDVYTVGTEYLIRWTIDWASGAWTVQVGGGSVLSFSGSGYTPPGPLYVEAGWVCMATTVDCTENFGETWVRAL